MPVGAPKGNNNAIKDRPWADAIRRSLAQFENDKVKQGHALRVIADKLVEKATEGDKDSINEIGNRLDGKPAQAIEGTGDGGAIIIKALALDDRI